MKKVNNIKVICVNSNVDLNILNQKFTLLVAELVKSGQIKWLGGKIVKNKVNQITIDVSKLSSKQLQRFIHIVEIVMDMVSNQK